MRVRRYRLFLAVAVFAVIVVYHLTKTNAWDGSDLEALVGLKTNHAGKQIGSNVDTLSPPVLPVDQPSDHVASSPHPSLPPPPAPDTASSGSNPSEDLRSLATEDELLAKQPSPDRELVTDDRSQPKAKPRPTEKKGSYWEQPEEHYPVPSHSLILLPTGQPKVLPAVQHRFGSEKPAARTDRLRKQTAIRETFKHAWFGYKNYSFPHDELKPLSKDVGDPFNGWGATLVDSLDALWIMGLYDEFAEAAAAVGKIDFKASPRKDIPVFETVIRYLGGLIAAYDLSSGKYQVLLDKAVELADILMGTFDTPNRMPAVFYHWAPSSTARPHRASAHTVLAEIGSLAMEFTRLAQITKENKYYDAIARVTDALEAWQMKTTFPGLWPLRLDASGCKRPEVLSDLAADKDRKPAAESVMSEVREQGMNELSPEEALGAEKRRSSGDGIPGGLTKRQQLSSAPPPVERAQTQPKATVQQSVKAVLDEDGLDDDDDCEPQGLSTEAEAKTHTYGIGSMADSTYEYFPKEYALLGGLNSQYKTMYLDSMDVVREELLFRPMTKQNHDILFLAKKNISPKHKNPKKRRETIYEGTHLGCYAGGMFALGSKLFDIPSDMNIAEKLTEGCVWAYGSTPAGIMPEEFEVAPCDSMTSCKWDEKKWHKALDEHFEERMQAVEAYNLQQQKLAKGTQSNAEVSDQKEQVVSEILSDPSMKKRDRFGEDEDNEASDSVDSESAGATFPLKVPLSHEKYVAAKIQEHRLPPGYTRITARDYRLRPEAIESVFIMYRLTGDKTWQDKGWIMFEAVDKATKTEIAHAGIKDVTSALGEQQDSMESFWLAETLKYYYLLFSEPDLISLDDYVL